MSPVSWTFRARELLDVRNYLLFVLLDHLRNDPSTESDRKWNKTFTNINFPLVGKEESLNGFASIGAQSSDNQLAKSRHISAHRKLVSKYFL